MLKILWPEPCRSKTTQLKRKASERASLSKKRDGGCIFNGGRLVSIVLALTLMVGQVFVLGQIPAFALDESCARELKEMGIIHGDQNGNLNTDQYMTRLEMSVLLSRIYGESDAATEYSGASDYKDASKIAEWGRKYADFAKKNGWMVGDDNGNFNPDGLITGEQLAVILLKKLGHEPGEWGSNQALFREKTGVAINNDTAMKRGEIFDVLYHAVYEKETGLSRSGRKVSVHETAGKVSVKRAFSEKNIPAFKKMKVDGGDKIVTEKNAWITLNFDDNTKLMLARSTAVKVEKLEKGETAASTVIVIEKGGIGTENEGELNPDSKYRIKTPTAVLSTHGAEFYVQVEESETTVWLAKGSLEIEYNVEDNKIKGIAGGGTEKTKVIDASSGPIRITIPKEETALREGEIQTEKFELGGLYEEFLTGPTFAQLGFSNGEIEEAVKKDREKRGAVGSTKSNDIDSEETVIPFYGQKGLAGLKDQDGKVILAPKYDHIDIFSYGLARVRKGRKHGYIDKTGREVIPPIYDEAWFFVGERALVGIRHEGIGANSVHYKYGYIDKTGREVIPPVYLSAGAFFNPLVPVFKVYEGGQGYGYIDNTGREIVPFIYNSAKLFNEGMAVVEKGTWEEPQFLYIDETGREVTRNVYTWAGDFRQGMGLVRNGNKDEGKYGFVDKTGSEVIPLIYDDAKSFSNGLASVKKDGKWGCIDKTGREVIPLIYDSIEWSFFEALATVGKDGKYGYIDAAGREVVPLVYDAAGSFDDVTPAVYHSSKSFSTGLALVGKGDDLEHRKFGFIDKTGREVIPLIYDRVTDFRNGLAGVKKDGKWGWIDQTGREVIPLIYDDAKSFSEGLAAVAKDGKWGYIDQTGREVIPLIYGEALPFSEGLAAVARDEKWGYIDNTGSEAIPLIYLNADSFIDGKARVITDEKFLFIDKQGNDTPFW